METHREARIVKVEPGTDSTLFGECRGRREVPDLILVDASTPGTEAKAVLHRARNDCRLRHVPVVFLCDTELQALGFMSAPERPNAVLVKPVTEAAFAEVVRQVRNWNLRLDLPDDEAYCVVRWPFQLAARGQSGCARG